MVYKHQKHSKCPQRNDDDETVSHVLQCQETTAQKTWVEAVESDNKWILDNEGCPDMTSNILTYGTARLHHL